MINKRRDERRRRGGFTLVELIVVLALLGILIAFSAGGMLGYTNYAQFKRNNESAKAVFSAAQSAMSYYKASGRLEELRSEVEGLSQSPAFVPVEAFDKEAAAGSSERESDTISYLMMSKSEETYKAIESAAQSGRTPTKEEVGEETELLFELLSDYITDVNIYDASICVEFDATDGVVSGVLYCDKESGFSYGDAEDKLNITKRDETYRRRKGIGYYSTELSERAPEKVEDLKLKAARLVNGETLDVQWFLEKKYQYLKGQQDYEITLKDDAGRKLVEIVLGKDEVGFISREEGGWASVEARSVTLYDPDDATNYIDLTTLLDSDEHVNFHAYLVQDETTDEKENYGSGIALSIDVLDSYLTEALNVTDPADPAAQEKALLSTFSARRLSYTKDGRHLGLPTDDYGKITATVSIGTAEDTENAQSTAAENVFFAAGKESGSAGPEYEIANARHLYNVNLREKEGPANITYKITNDFAWGGPEGLLSHGGQGNGTDEAATWVAAKFYNQQSVYEYNIATEGERTRYPAFPGIDVLRGGSTLLSAKSEAASEETSEGEDDEEKGDDAEDAGSGAKEPPYTIGYLTLEPKKADGTVPLGKVGLVRENSGTIQDLRLADVDVRGIVKKAAVMSEDGTAEENVWLSGEDVGTFCGTNSGKLQNVETVSGYVTGGRNVGGIMGSIAASAQVSGVKNGAEVSGIENVGGIVGLLEGYSLAPEDGTEIRNTGIVYGWELPEGATLNQFAADGTSLPESNKVTARYIGGIAGHVANGARLLNCVSVPVMEGAAAEGVESGAAAPSEEELQKYLHGNYVGGIVGYLDTSSSISNCVAGAADASTSYILGENFVGGIVGWNQGTLTADESAKTVSGTVLGRNFVGGIAGYNDGMAMIGNYTTNGITVGGNNFVGGVIGLNTSAAQVTGDLSWNAASVAGNCYVGGYAGANIIAPSGQIMVTVASGAGANAVTANGAFAGGLFGYNRIVTATKMTELQTELQTVGMNTTGTAVSDDGTVAESGDITKMLSFADQAADASGDGLPYVVDAIFSIDETDKSGELPGVSMLIQGSEPAGETQQQVSARIFAGGVLGYNASQTELTIQNYTGTALVTANGAVSGSMLEDKYGLARKYGDGKTYSFSGGILGYVTEKTTLDHCSLNSSVATDETGATTLTGASVAAPAATYLGGLAEINEGTIRDCSAAAINGAENDNVGGIVGVNGAGVAAGTGSGITACKVPGSAVVIGRSMAGGIAAENYGLIELNGEIAAAGGSVAAGGNASVKASLGGVAGVNRETIRVTSGSSYNGEIRTAGAAYVGGVAGENYGTIEAVPGDNGAVFTATLGDDATAPATLGGIAGSNEGTIQNLTYSGEISGNGNSVNKEEAYAYGGIAGINTGNGIIVKCGLNGADIRLNGSSYLGGIAGRNSGNALIRDIAPGPDSTAAIISSGAFATGGIAGANEDRATVENLSNGSRWQIQAKAQTDAVVQTGAAAPVGGIIGCHTSSEGLYGLTNNAGSEAESVESAGVLNEGEEAGGIVGEVAMVQSDDPNAVVIIQDCYNYGPVQASGKAGGIIGMWASDADGGVRGCFNGKTSTPDPNPAAEPDPGDEQATVRAANAAGAAAGIIGGFSNMTAGQTVELLSCANFGVTEGKFGAGIAVISGMQQNTAAGNGQSGQPVVKLTDCSNAGRNENGAGIAVYYSGKAGNISLQLDRCRNYGRPTETDNADKEFAGLVACVYDESGNAVFDGNSTKADAEHISIRNSIGVADVTYPTVPAAQNPTDVSARYGNEHVYYYSSDGFATELISTAGIGAAVNYSDGSTSEGETRSYLKAVNALLADLEEDGVAFDPNGKTSDGKSYEQDCRGNYNRLEFTLASACLKLERNEKDVDVNTTPVPKVEAANNGGMLNITWKNRETGDDVLQTETENAEGETDSEIAGEEADGTSENGVIYKSVLKISLYDSQEEAKNDKGSTGEAMVPEYEITFYGDSDSASHNVRVGKLWMGKWARVAVTNYSYKDSYGSKTSSATGVTTIQILPELKDPELVVRLKEAGTEQPVYELDLLNKKDYLDACTLNVTVQAEELAEAPVQEPETTPEGSGTAPTAAEGEQSGAAADTIVTEVTTDAQAEEPVQTEARTASVQLHIPLKDAEGKSTFPYPLTLENLAIYSPEASTFFASSATAKVHLSLTDAQMIPTDTDQKAPSAKKSFTALNLSDKTLTEGVYKETPKMGRSGNTVTVTLAGEPALYRSELLYDVMLDDCLIEDLVVAATRQETTGETISMSMEIPADQTEETARARVYPLEVSGTQAKDGAKLGYLVASGLTLDELMNKYNGTYVNVEETPVQQPVAITAQTETPVETQQSETETETSQQEDTQTVAVGSVAPVTPIAGEAQDGNAENPETPETPAARATVKALDGYSLVRSSDGTLSVYYSELMKEASLYKANVYTWEEEKSEGQPETTSAAGAGGAGSPVAPVSQDEPESDTEDEWEEGEEEETETGTETESDEKVTETEIPKLSTPQNASLSPNWDNAGTDINNEPREAVPESEFRNSLVLMVDPVTNADVYAMRAGFYSEMPSSGKVPDSAMRLFSEDEEFNNRFNSEMSNAMSGLSYMFRDVPTEFAGKYLCVQLQAYSGSGKYEVSEWSDYLWFHLPKVCLESPVLTRGIATVGHMMTDSPVTAEPLPEGEVQPETETELQQLSLSWEQEKYESFGTEKTDAIDWNNCGYTIDLYKMLPFDTATDSDEYKEPTATVNLMRAGEDGYYYLERRPTKLEKEKWEEDHKDETPMPEILDPWPVDVPSVATRTSYGEEYKQEFESSLYLKAIYELKLDENALGLGLPGYSIDLSETVDGVGTRTISNICPIIQIREYTDESFIDVVRIEYKLILPDIDMVDPLAPESAVPFLYDYLRYYCTHSVTVRPLRQSVFTAVQNDAIQTNRTQSTYLVNAGALSGELKPSDLLTYQRTLEQHTEEPGDDKFDKKFDPEKEMNIFGPGYDPNDYVLLPRNYMEALIDQSGEVPAAIAQTDDFDTLDANAAGEISFTFDENGELVFDTEQNDTIDETVPTTDGVEFPADDDVIVEEDPSVPEYPTETQTSGQPLTEIWTEASQTSSMGGSSVIPMDSGTIDGEGY